MGYNSSRCHTLDPITDFGKGLQLLEDSEETRP
jgi:hypothetical protein